MNLIVSLQYILNNFLKKNLPFGFSDELLYGASQRDVLVLIFYYFRLNFMCHFAPCIDSEKNIICISTVCRTSFQLCY